MKTSILSLELLAMESVVALAMVEDDRIGFPIDTGA